jgi:adenylosuccinate lyase
MNPSDANPESTYQSPLAGRYASGQMRELFSAQTKHSAWRRCWLALAEAEQELGLEIPDAAIEQMRAHLDDIDFDAAAAYEKTFRHDVMAHVHAFGDAAPAAKGVLHLGATSQFVNCNTELLLMRRGLDLLIGYLANVVDRLGAFAAKYRDLPTLGFTHYQPAQPTTVGKRATLWCYDFAADLAELAYRRDNLRLRGAKGATGTQASYLALFNGDHAKVDALDRLVCKKLGLEDPLPVTGQTYPRKIDWQVLSSLAGVGVSVHKFCNDVRLLAGAKELEEPFEKTQIGSSAMAYKRNPMRCERATGLARWLIDIAPTAAHTAAEQWLERTLDDSANRRMSLPEAFLTADAILRIVMNVAGGMVVYPKVIEARLAAELPFMATENILMAAVAAGGDRQELHERIRTHSQNAAEAVKQRGEPNDLLDRLRNDEAFAGVDLAAECDPARFVGRAPEQVDRFIAEVVEPIRRSYADRLGAEARLNV